LEATRVYLQITSRFHTPVANVSIVDYTSFTKWQGDVWLLEVRMHSIFVARFERFVKIEEAWNS